MGRRRLEPPWWWRPHLRLWFLRDWWYRERPVMIWRDTLAAPEPWRVRPETRTPGHKSG